MNPKVMLFDEPTSALEPEMISDSWMPVKSSKKTIPKSFSITRNLIAPSYSSARLFINNSEANIRV